MVDMTTFKQWEYSIQQTQYDDYDPLPANFIIADSPPKLLIIPMY